ncbi:MAG: HD domain-containing phosphohydrolase [Thermoanaerobaculales bacterium]
MADARLVVDRPLLRSLLVLVSVIEARDRFTGGHVWRTSRYARLLAAKLGLSSGDVFLAQLGGIVHDVGKVGIPDAILNKRGAVSAEERAILQLHPEIGEEILANHPLAALVETPVLEHHLRLDGTGYPARLADRAPSLISRIVAIADTFDAITAFRPYRGGNVLDHAMAELTDARGTQLDAASVDAFLALAGAGELDHVLGHAGEGRPMLACRDCGPIIAPPQGTREGDTVICPSCTGEFVLHVVGDTFDLEWRGAGRGVYRPRPDTAAVDEVLDAAPPVVDVPRKRDD